MAQHNVRLSVLLVTKKPGDSHSFIQFFNKWKCDCQVVHAMKEAREQLKRKAFQLVLSELQPADGKVAELISMLKGSKCSLFLSLPVEDACWWLPAVSYGCECLGKPALRPKEFTQALDQMLEDAAFPVDDQRNKQQWRTRPNDH